MAFPAVPAPPVGNPLAPALTVAAVRLSPRLPRAGRPFGVSVVVVRSGSRRRVAFGHVVCLARAGGKPVRVAFSGFRRGAAACTWRIPLSARGARLVGFVQVTVPGATVAQRLAARIR